jgi:RES domain-containing protein
MALQSYIQPWSGLAVRHIPQLAVQRYDIYDFSYAGRSAENRWNRQGQTTLYLAKEKNVALAEYARHLKIDRSAALISQVQERAVYQFDVRLNAAIDFCRPEVWQELSLSNAPECFKDKNLSRSCADFIRYTTEAEAMFVPSMAFLDAPEQWCLVMFLEKLPAEVREFLPAVRADGSFRVD